MAGKISARSARVAFVAEVTPGVTPVTPAFQTFRATGEGLEVIRTLSFTSELNGKRGQSAHSLASRGGSGPIESKWSDGTHEALLESVLRNTWAADILTDATAQKPFTFEVMYEGGATDIYKRLTGAEINTFNIAMRVGEDTSVSFGIMALDSDYANAAIAGATYAAATTTPVLNGGDFGALAMAGLTVGCVSALNLNISNNLAEVRCLGTLGATDLDGSATLEVTGSLAIALTSDEYDVLRASADATSTSLTFEVGRTAGQKTRFELPNIVLSDTNAKAEDAESGTILITPNFRAMQATSLGGSVIRVTRNI